MTPSRGKPLLRVRCAPRFGALWAIVRPVAGASGRGAGKSLESASLSP